MKPTRHRAIAWGWNVATAREAELSAGLPPMQNSRCVDVAGPGGASDESSAFHTGAIAPIAMSGV